MIQTSFDVKQKVSSLIAFAFVISLGLVLSWYSIKTSEEILANMPNSEIIRIDKRMQNENLQESIEIKKMLEQKEALRNKNASKE